MSTLSVDTIQGQTTAANLKLPAGTVLQTVNATHATQTSTTSASYVATKEPLVEVVAVAWVAFTVCKTAPAGNLTFAAVVCP